MQLDILKMESWPQWKKHTNCCVRPLIALVTKVKNVDSSISERHTFKLTNMKNKLYFSVEEQSIE